MDDPRAADSAEHLQTAARELIRAARSFLDLVEDVVEEPERLSGAIGSVAGMVRDGLVHFDRGGRAAAWSEPAWETDEDDDDTIDLDDLYVIDDELRGEEPPDPEELEEDHPHSGSAPPSRRAPRSRTSTSRVRRIAVE